ncbi:MAG: hypothetical protein IIC49_02425 [Planctomycetes bacterium]|nr:hypothetical protein [Planctomycetota bacterium]
MKCAWVGFVCHAVLVSPCPGQSGKPGVVELVLRDSVFDTSTPPPWVVVAAVVGALFVIVGAVLFLAWVRGARAESRERAFRLLARRLKIGIEARETVRRVASAYGCAPVALLVCERALQEAITAYRSTSQGRAQPARIERLERRLLAD